MGWLVPILVAVAVAWIFSTTPAGKRLLDRLGLELPRRASKAPSEDHAFLLQACNGDYEELERRLADEVRRAPHSSEAEAYRKAIRRVFNERKTPRSH